MNIIFIYKLDEDEHEPFKVQVCEDTPHNVIFSKVFFEKENLILWIKRNIKESNDLYFKNPDTGKNFISGKDTGHILLNL